MDRIAFISQLMLQKRATTEAYGQYISALREYLPGSNLYMREVHFIAAASPTQAISIAQIAHKMEVTPGAVSQIAARLEKKGYITRCRAPGDRRQILVSLTEDGRRLYAWHEAYDRRCMEEFAQHMADFTDEQLEKLMIYEKLCWDAFVQPHRFPDLLEK